MFDVKEEPKFIYIRVSSLNYYNKGEKTLGILLLKRGYERIDDGYFYRRYCPYDCWRCCDNEIYWLINGLGLKCGCVYSLDECKSEGNPYSEGE